MTSQVAERAARARTRGVAVVTAVPVWAWLSGIVVVSAVAHFLVALDYPGPYTFVDELVYSEMAKSFASGGDFLLRGVPTTLGYPRGYSVLISPAYALFNDVPHAYDAIKVINAVMMSSAAVPAYFVARRLAGQTWALLAAALSVSIPPMLYTSLVMTESAFYPAFMFFVWALVAALERPTPIRQVAPFALMIVAYEIRTQAVALLPAALTAIVLVALAEAVAVPQRRTAAFWRRLRAFWVSGLLVGVVVVGVVVYEKARGHAIRSVLGGYEWTSSVHYSAGVVSRWYLYHLAELDLALGVIPVVAFIVLVSISFRRAAAPELRVFSAATLPILFWLTLVVAAFASKADVNRIEERNLFYVMPFFLIGLVAWAGRGAPRPPRATAVGALIAAALPGAIPYQAFLNERAVSDTFGILILGHLQNRFVAPSQLGLVVVLAAIVGAAFFVLVPRRAAVLAPALVLAFLASSQRWIERDNSQASKDAYRAGIGIERDWIDRAVGRNADVAVLYTGQRPFVATWDTEFFNRSVRTIYNFGLFFDGLPQTQLAPDAHTGVLRDAAGNRPSPQYVLSDDTMLVRGQVVARDAAVGLTLYRPRTPIALFAQTSGIYPDTWSGRQVVYSIYDCNGGTLAVDLLGDPGIIPHPQTIVATLGTTGRVLARTTAQPGRRVRFSVPLVAEKQVCGVTFTVSPTSVPAQTIGTPDTRELGIRFQRPVYRPAR